MSGGNLKSVGPNSMNAAVIKHRTALAYVREICGIRFGFEGVSGGAHRPHGNEEERASNSKSCAKMDEQTRST